MTKKEFASLGKALLPTFPDFAVKGSLMHVSPIGNLLQGICFDGSSFSKTAFYAHYFVQPLFIPRDHLTLSWGDRVREKGVGDCWDKNKEFLVEKLRTAIQDSALAFFAKTATVPKLMSYLRSLKPYDPYINQALAYSLVIEGLEEEAVCYIDELISRTEKTVAWQVDLADQVSTFKRLLLLDPAAARQKLRDWKVETLTNLKLAKPETTLN